MKLYKIMLVQVIQVKILVEGTGYLVWVDDINDNYQNRFIILLLQVVNTLFLINLIIGIKHLPKISINNNLYDHYYINVFINSKNKNNQE